MKKWIVLLLSTSLLLGAALSVESLSSLFLPTVETVLLKPSDIRQCVQATGKVVVRGQREVHAEYPMVVGEVAVREGDRVEKDQILLTVDVNATLETLREYAYYDESLAELAERPDLIPTEIKAPESANVLSVSAEPGMICTVGTLLVTLSKGTDLQVEANIGEDLISQVRIGQEVVITGPGFKGREYGGVVDRVQNTAKQVTGNAGTVTVVGTVIAVRNPDEFLKPGFTATVQIVTDSDRNRLVVPYETVAQDAKGQEFMYVYRDGWVVRRNIKSNRETAEGIEVVEGVRVGETVVVDPGRLQGYSLRVKAKSRRE